MCPLIGGLSRYGKIIEDSSRGKFIMRVLFIFLFISSNVFAAQALTWTQEAIPKKIHMCWHNGYPYSGEKLEDGGLLADFTSTVMREAGFLPEVHFVPWARCKEGVKNGQYDMLFAMWNDVDEHERDFDFFLATDIQETSFVVLQDSKLKSSKLTELNNLRLALHLNGGYDLKITNHNGFEYSYVSSDIQKIKMLKLGRVDLMIGDPKRFDYDLRVSIQDNKTKLRSLIPPLKEQRTSPAIAKNNPHKKELIRRYNNAYLRLCKKGTLTSIINKHKFNFKPVDCPKK
jgi:polar amino acid transport system substrate-binding protein